MKNLIEKIKQNGYWKITMHPTVFNEKRIATVDDCKKIVESSKVFLRGWDYPHIGRKGIKISGNDNVESFCNCPEGGLYEYWRFYQSGQFVHYFAIREDYALDESKMKKIQATNSTKSTRFLSILSSLYTVTEIFEFAQRLANKNLFDDSVNISIELGNSENRELFFWDTPWRPLFDNYICTFRGENIIVKRIISKEDLIAKTHSISLDACMELFKKFNWNDPPKSLFEQEQEKFLQKRL